MSEKIVHISPDLPAQSRFAAELFNHLAREAFEARGRFLVSLSGGSTPKALYRLLVGESLPWDRILFFWGDERCVPPQDAESCYNQAHRMLLGYVRVPAKNIFRIKGELKPETAAAEYAQQLKELADPGLAWPRFDLCLLGLGADGHTAALFPGSAETSGIATVAATANYQDRPANRVSLTPDVFNAARNVVFLAAGQEKAEALSKTLTGNPDPVNLPAQRIHPGAGNVLWLVDESAASQLPEKITGFEIQR
jgi:6-phosphogluconolactonase